MGRGKRNNSTGSSRKPNKTARRKHGKNNGTSNNTTVVVRAAVVPPCDDMSSRAEVDTDPKYVIKSPLDSNDYMVFEMSNGLKVLLISTCDHEKDLGGREINANTGNFVKVEEFNRHFAKIPDCDSNGIKGKTESKTKKDTHTDWEPEVKKARGSFKSEKPKIPLPRPVAICLGVDAGHTHNPQDIPGMAHLCEHACASFGSKKFPEVSTLIHEAHKAKGYFNACTLDEHTLYHVQLDLNLLHEDGFERILDVLSDAIQNPLLPADRVKREILAVDCEFGLREYNDISRMWHLLCSTTNPNHPFGRFSCGNSACLNQDDLHKRIEDWKDRHYAANYMTLTVKAELPLKEMKKTVEKYFVALKRSEKPSPMVELLKAGNPFNTKNFKKLYMVYPVADQQLMVITWTLPAKFAQNYETKPLGYLSSFFGDGSSLMGYLRKEHWAYSMKATSPFGTGQNSFCSLFSIMISLTDKGVHEMFRVVTTIYSYLKLIMDSKPQEEIFNNLRRENADAFHYSKNSLLMRNSAELFEFTCNLRKLKDPKYILTSRTLMINFDPKIIQECVTALTPKNMNIMVSSKSFRGVCKEIEPWFKTKYTSSDLTEKFLRRCENPDKISALQLPDKNKFKQQNILCPVPTHPGILQLEQLPTMFLKNNKAMAIHMKLNLCDPGIAPNGMYNVFIANPTINATSIGSGLLDIWLAMMQDHLRKTLHQVKKSRVQTIAMPLGGNSIMICLSGPPVNHTKILKTLLHTFDNFEKEGFANEDSFNDFKELYKRSCSNVTLNSEIFAMDLHDFILKENHSLFDHTKAAVENASFEDLQNFIRAFKSKMYIQAILFGCVTEPNAREVAGLIEGMKYRALPEIFSTPVSRAMQLPLGEHCIRVISRNELDKISRVVNFYQFGNLGKDETMKMMKISHVMMIHAFVQLRNVENLSYVVQVCPSSHAGAVGIRFQVSPQPHRHTTSFVDERMDVFLATFRENFGNYHEFFKESGNTQFCSRDEHKMMLEMYDNYLLPTGKFFRKLSIQVVGNYDESKFRNEPEEAVGLKSKILKYGNGSNSESEEKSNDDNREPDRKIFAELNINHDVPKCCEDKNGYFITDLEAFKNSLFCFPR